MGASDKSDRAGGLRPEPAAQSQPKALIPSALAEQACAISKTGATVTIECDDADDANELFDWLAAAPVPSAGMLVPASVLMTRFLRYALAYGEVAHSLPWWERRKRAALLGASAAMKLEAESLADLSAQAMSASGQDPQGLEAKPASAVPDRGCALTPTSEPSL